MHRLLRNTHLLLGLFCCAYLLMYGVSGVQMGHTSWFNSKPSVTESRINLPPETLSSPRLVALELMNRHGFTGDMRDLRLRGDGYSFSIVRPGRVYEVRHETARSDVLLRTNVANFVAMLNRIHHTGGFWHEHLAINLFGVFVAIVSVSVIVMALTGIYLWFKIHSERRIGATLLALSLGYSLTLMVLMRMA